MELFQRILTKDEINHRFILATTAILAKQLIPNKTALAESLNIKPANVASIVDYAGNLELSFIDYSMDEKPKYDVEECKARDCIIYKAQNLD